jgi:molybdopterin adenylyltransferase
MSYEEHTKLSRDTPVRCAVVTVSDSRDEESDRSGRLIRTALEEAGHSIVSYRIVPDEADRIGDVIDEMAPTCEVILLNGGTGISRRDTTVEVVNAKLEKSLAGFGELFRMLSYDEIGAGAMLSRATAGLYRDTLIFSMPGSTNAVRLALEKLIVPELRHLVWEVVRQHA